MVTTKNPKVEFWSGKVLYPAIVVLLVLSGFFAMAILPRLVDGSHPMVGRPAPEFALPLLAVPSKPFDGKLSSLRGKVVVLDFWAPWCKPCRAEMPELDALARKLATEDVAIVGVMVDGDSMDARMFLKDANIGYVQLEDDKGQASHDYAVRSLPSIVVIDKQGTVRSYHSGVWTGEEVEDAIRRAM
jgi:thiol-disulfide isomerase/thioredoxin